MVVATELDVMRGVDDYSARCKLMAKVVRCGRAHGESQCERVGVLGRGMYSRSLN